MTDNSCFGDIVKHNNNFDQTLATRISRYCKCKSDGSGGDGGGNGHILVTESVNLVANYDTKSGTNLVPTESWIFPQLNRLDFPVVTYRDKNDGGAEYMLAIQEPNSLTKWTYGGSSGHTDIKTRVAKYFVNTAIAGIIALDNNNNNNGQTPPAAAAIEPIVVYANGYCQIMSEAIQTRRVEQQQSIIADDESIEFIDGFVDQEIHGAIVVYLITKAAATAVADNDSTNNSQQIKSIYRLVFSTDTNVIVKTDRQQLLANQSFTNWSLSLKTKTILSVAKKSPTNDNQFVIYSMDGQSVTELFPLVGTSMKRIISLSATRLGSVCIIGQTMDGNYGMELWESQYGSRLGGRQLVLPYEPMPNDSTVIDDTVFITCFKGILAIPLRVQTISLSQIVGKVKTSAKQSDFESDINKQLKSICEDFQKVKTDDSFDEIINRLTVIVEQMNGIIAEEFILKLVRICSTKIQENRNSEDLRTLLETLLSLPFNDMFMISQLKSSQLSWDQILVILELLSDLLPSSKHQIFDWISILMDSHIQEFLMNPNDTTVKVLEQIDSKVDLSGQLFENMDQIMALMDRIRHKDKLLINDNKSIQPIGQYCIQILRF
ncbi:uncharacterized protein LOC128956095 [Oppia nitens]|uniref:uncharacterized protein LOC128956095 n=1 Tax=Oppia nitens TaxID=1686743 RepID=UPI0023DCE75A|nr:uncharacterized protein LOC128956095 [Oppia nitens]